MKTKVILILLVLSAGMLFAQSIPTTNPTKTETAQSCPPDCKPSDCKPECKPRTDCPPCCRKIAESTPTSACAKASSPLETCNTTTVSKKKPAQTQKDS